MIRILMISSALIWASAFAHAQESAPATSAPIPPKPSETHLGLPPSGFVLEARLGAGTSAVGSAGAFTLIQPSLTLAGRFADRVQLGLGLALQHYAATGTLAAGIGGEYRGISFTLVPTAEIDLVRAGDRRVALYLKLGLPVGGIVQKPGNDMAIVGLDMALGVRYAPHRMFSVGFEAGATGLFVDPGHSYASESVVVYGAIVGSFYAQRHRHGS